MAIIVKIPLARVRTSREPRVEEGATILFFTGVRYCREIDPEPEQECALALHETAPPPVMSESAMIAFV